MNGDAVGKWEDQCEEFSQRLSKKRRSLRFYFVLASILIAAGIATAHLLNQHMPLSWESIRIIRIRIHEGVSIRKSGVSFFPGEYKFHIGQRRGFQRFQIIHFISFIKSRQANHMLPAIRNILKYIAIMISQQVLGNVIWAILVIGRTLVNGGAAMLILLMSVMMPISPN